MPNGKERFNLEAALTNFEKALYFLEKGQNTAAPDIIEKARIIKFFGMYYELSRKAMMDYLGRPGIFLNALAKAYLTQSL